MGIIKAPTTPVAATHFLFDMDGLLLNTDDQYTVAANQILAPFGKTYDLELKVRIMGRREDEAVAMLVRELNIPLTVEDYLAQRRAILAKLFPLCTPLPGVQRFVSHLHAHQQPMAIATSSHHDLFLIKSTPHPALFSMFGDHIVTGDHAQVTRGKPAADIYLVAHAKLGRGTHERATAIVFEDAMSGVQAGLAAGMQVVWIRDRKLPVTPEMRAVEEQCFAVVESMEEVDPQWLGLSSYSN
ncbi:HAD-like domain-containing protein [Blastocladiella britannica]|nr:HAD-like domain-containing protein [Blastocladiella britannica]